MINKKLLFVFALLLLVTFVNAESDGSILTGQKNACIDLPQECADCSYVTLTTVVLPNFTRLNIQEDMTKTGTSFNYTYCKTDSIGDYSYCVLGDPSSTDTVVCKDFKITPTGQRFSDGQGFTSLGIMAGALVLAFFFLFIGFKFGDNPRTKPIGLFFGIIAIFLAIYSLQLGLNFSVDILQYDGLSGIQSAMYISILWLVSGIAIISFILMAIGFIKNFGKDKMLKNFGDGFDPISQTYQ